MISESCECCEIIETDILWNLAYSWTDSTEVAIGNYNVILLSYATMHELGHSWGYQRDKYAETYDYDRPSVMHGYYHDLVEDGEGIHASDANIIRKHYDDQTGIINITDIGVESYYASNGLINSSTNGGSYNRGDSITLSNVTVENMSNLAVSDLRLRFFLSKDRHINSSDYQIGSYWSWSSFCAGCRNIGTYTTTIPTNISPGTYYVGAMVTRNGFSSDNFSPNNTTSFYKTISIR